MKKGLPPVAMTIAVGLAWTAASVPFITYAAASAITLTVMWVIVKMLGIR